MTQRPVELDSQDFASALGRAVVEAGDMAVVVVDAGLVVQDANRAAQEALGDLAPGTPLSDSVDAGDVERLRRRAAAGDGSGEPLLLRASAEPVRPSASLLVSVVPLAVDDGTFLALVGRVATPDLEREARILRARRWEIVGQLSSGIAHDLNNRLSTVTTFSDLMLEDAEPDSQEAEDLAEIKQAGLDSARITRKLDLFAGGHAAGQTDCTLPDVVRGFEKLIRRFVGDAIKVETDLHDHTPGVGAPPIRLEEVLIALVANAREAMPGGGRLMLRATGGGPGDPEGSAVLEVRDTGDGHALPPLERALEPFFSSKPHGIGSGLGLGTVGGIVTELGGSLSLHRTDGETVVRVVLPGLRHADGQDEARAEEEAAGTPGVRVGLVEPDDVGRRALTRGLEQGGARVVAAASPAELDLTAFPLDAVVLDVPDGSDAGLRLIADVRQRGGEVPVVLLRRRSSPRATLPGTPGVLELAKPTDLGRIRSAILQAVERRDARTDAQ